MSALPRDPAPKLAPEQKTRILELQKESLQFYIQIQQVQKKYEDALRADPEFVKLSKANDEVSAKLQAAVNEATKGIDQKKWTLDYQNLDFKPVTPPAAPAAAPPTKKP